MDYEIKTNSAKSPQHRGFRINFSNF